LELILKIFVLAHFLYLAIGNYFGFFWPLCLFFSWMIGLMSQIIRSGVMDYVFVDFQHYTLI